MESLLYAKTEKFSMEKGLPFECWTTRTFKHIDSAISPYTFLLCTGLTKLKRKTKISGLKDTKPTTTSN